jgi:hypothetical protein
MIFFRRAPFFAVKEIRCAGNAAVSAEEIIAASTISYEYNLFRVSVKKAASRIAAIPYVRAVTVKRKLPNRIEIKITECEVRGYLPLNEGYIYIDGACKMLEYNSVPPAGVPVIQNTGVLSYEGGKRLLADDDKKTDAVAAVIAAARNHFPPEQITAIDAARADDLTLLYNNKLEIRVGNVKDLDYKLNIALRAISDKLGENAGGYLDVSNPASGSGSVYREKK